MDEMIAYFKKIEARLDRIEAAMGFESPLEQETWRVFLMDGKIAALKHYRNETGASLKEALAALEAMQDKKQPARASLA